LSILHCRSDAYDNEDVDDIDGWSATESLSTSISQSVTSSVNIGPSTGYLGGSSARDLQGRGALYRNEIADASQASAIARAGALLRRTMQASEGLTQKMDALASGSASLSEENLNRGAGLAERGHGALPRAAPSKSISTLEAELELVNKRLAQLRKAQSSDRKHDGGQAHAPASGMPSEGLRSGASNQIESM
jgi:hypothetical protein